MTLGELNMSPNNNQLGVAVATRIIFKGKSKKKVFIVVPPGQGKSRIIAAIATLFFKEKPDKLKKIHVIFSSQRLL